MNHPFASRVSVQQVEEGRDLAPKFDASGLLPAVTTDYLTGELLMLGYMNAEALQKTIKTGEAHYFSRSRQVLWHKGGTSGFVQQVREMRVDDDQDCIWLRVETAGSANCHVGYRSCFYRAVPLRQDFPGPESSLVWKEEDKVFDPKAVYGSAPNPTQL
ncbi:phosphoribosyl-AMP cyclohydrolase [Prosthecobacter sp. SYSU 5D2]|uniref:phosphoribosyl-AMP cyclohydrolase n=1 Tax=Prosthecobacter sp. SYSU 5D2 TaxID=3134134 RepID=UPI0031FEA64D